MLRFKKLTTRENIPNKDKFIVYLQEDNWDDFGFKTIFNVVLFDEYEYIHELGTVKIGYKGQKEGWTTEKIPTEFYSLEDDFFSLGQDREYYQKVYNELTSDCRRQFLIGINDVVYREHNLSVAVSDTKTDSEDSHSVFNYSLLRFVSYDLINRQFKRILRGGAVLTEFDFFYKSIHSSESPELNIKFKVNPYTKPSSNIHVLIGRNGVGKTTLLNSMINTLLRVSTNDLHRNKFYQVGMFGEKDLEEDYFHGVVSVSFSAFDPFEPPEPKSNNNGICYHYIGLKTTNQPLYNGSNRLKTTDELCAELVESLKVCLTIKGKRERWVQAVRRLESDVNVKQMDLISLVDIALNDKTDRRIHLESKALEKFSKLSSGHAIVLLIITRLIETVEEKTLVIIDEPESHLHPPLLSAFTRSLSDLLLNRNGVAIVATHSPVVLQEVPRTCVSILRRTGLETKIESPVVETFGENVGTLTREVFGLEVSKSGFYDLLAKQVEKGKSYNQILTEYNQQLGYEGKAILRALIGNGRLS